MITTKQLRAAFLAGAAILALNAGEAWAQECVTPPTRMSFWYAADGSDSERIGNLTATRHGSVSDVAARFDQGVQIPAGSWVSFPDDPALDVGASDFSIDAWVQTRGRGTVPVVDKRLAPTGSRTTGYFLFIQNGRLGLQLGDGEFRNVIASGPSINDGRWHHVAATVDRRNRRVTLWVDGRQVQTSSHMPPPGASLDNDVRLMIGRGYVREDGAIAVDEVEIIRRLLQASEIQALAQRPKCKEPEAFDVAVNKIGPDRAGRYTVQITNVGRALQAGAVIRLRDVVPAGMIVTGIPGAPWQCDAQAPMTGPDALTCTMTAPTVIQSGAALPPITLSARGAGACPNCVRVDVFENRRAFEANFRLPEPDTANNSSCAGRPARP